MAYKKAKTTKVGNMNLPHEFLQPIRRIQRLFS